MYTFLVFYIYRENNDNKGEEHRTNDLCLLVSTDYNKQIKLFQFPLLFEKDGEKKQDVILFYSYRQ